MRATRQRGLSQAGVLFTAAAVLCAPLFGQAPAVFHTPREAGQERHATLDVRLFDYLSALRFQEARDAGKPVRITLNPAAGIGIPVTLEHVHIWNRGETISWQGTVETPIPGLFRLSISGESVTGYLHTGDGRRYEFGGPAGDVRIVEADQGPPTAPCPLVAPPAAKRTTPRATSANEPRHELPGPASLIDILVLYTPAARQRAESNGQDIVTQIREAVDYTNVAYAQSGLDIRLNLAGTAEVAYTETTSCQTTLQDLSNPNDGKMDNVEALRTQYGADLVSLVAITGAECGGIAWLLQDNSTDSDIYGFSVAGYYTKTEDRNRIFAHEIGHNLGSAHERGPNSPTPGLFPYSYGYRQAVDQPDRKRDIMAYSCQGTSADLCPPVPYFSSPLVTVSGYPLGKPAGDPESADAALTFTLSAPTIEAYRPRAGGAAITLTPEFIAAPSGGGVFTVKAMGTGAWATASTVSWITNVTPVSGNGDASVSFSIAINATGAVRRGSVRVGPVTVIVEQAANPTCTAVAVTPGTSVNGTLGNGSCTSPLRGNTLAQRYKFTGTAGQQVAIQLDSAAFDTHLYLLNSTNTVLAENGDSSGTNSRIPQTSGFYTLPASGEYTIEATSFAAGATGAFTLTVLASGCNYAVSPALLTESAAGATRSIALTTGGGCAWQTASSVPWLAFNSAPTSGSGAATVQLTIAANATTESRSGTVTIGGSAVTVNQSPPSNCAATTIGLNTPTPGALSAAAGCRSQLRGSEYYAARYRFSVGATQQVRFLLESPDLDTYLYLTGPGTSLQDDDSAGSANSAIPSLSGYVTLGPGEYTLEATTFGPGAAGSFWLVALPAGGTDAAQLTSGVEKAVTLPAVASPSLFGFLSSSWAIPVPAGSGRLEVRLTTQTAGADVDLFVNRGGVATVSSGSVNANYSSRTLNSGNETVIVTPLSPTALQSGTHYINLAQLTANTPATATLRATVFPTAASASFSPSTATVGAAAGTGSVNVTPSPSDGAWLVSSNAAWLQPDVSSGAGPGAVSYSYSTNTGATRSAALTIAGQSFPVTQAAAAATSVTLSASSASVAAVGESGSVTVTPTPAGTSFTVTGQPAWLTVTVNGNTVNWTAAANGSIASRIATLNIGGQTYTITQAGMAGTVVLSPTSATVVSAGGSGAITVTPTPADFTTWTVSGAPDWLTVTRSGNTVNWTAAANSGPTRTATLTIGGQNFSLTQSSAPAPAVVQSPFSGTGLTKTFSIQFRSPAGLGELGVVNVLINDALNGNAACYLAYSYPAQVVYLVRDQGPGAGLDGGFALGATGSAANSQCTIASAGSSVVTVSPDTIQLNLNLTFSGAFQGSRLVYAAARNKAETLNSGWQLVGTHEVPGGTVTYPRSAAASPAAGSTANATITYVYEDASTNTNLQTAWALINTAVDGRQACYLAYYAPGNALYLIPDNGDGSQATSIALTGTNTIENSQCRISAAGSSVTRSGNRLTVTLNYTFKSGFSGYRGIWTAVQTLGGAQTSPWRAAGSWLVP